MFFLSALLSFLMADAASFILLSCLLVATASLGSLAEGGSDQVACFGETNGSLDAC